MLKTFGGCQLEEGTVVIVVLILLLLVVTGRDIKNALIVVALSGLTILDGQTK